MKEKMPLVEVVWLDATSKYETSDHSLKEENEIALGKTVSVGYVLEENLSLISLAQSIFFAPRPETDLKLYRHIQTIPKKCILQKRVIPRQE